MEILKCPSCKSGNVELIRIDNNDEGMKCKDCGALVRWYSPIEQEAKSEIKEEFNNVRPIPCVRDEHGEIKEQSVKQLIGKVNEELDELKEAIIILEAEKKVALNEIVRKQKKHVAEEAADTITAITTLCEALNIHEDMRNKAIRLVNEKNRKRGRL